MNIYRNLLLPSWGILTATGLGAVMICMAAWLLVQQPWLGIKIGITEDRFIVVEHVIPGSPADGALKQGDKIVALIGNDDTRIQLQPTDLMESLDRCSTFELYRHALERHQIITSIISQAPIGIELTDGTTVTLTPSPTRALSSILPGTWLILLVGTTGFLIAATTLLLRHKSTATQLFFVSGLSFQISAWGAAIYSGRELAIDVLLARIATTSAISGAELLAISLTALIWSYPKPVSRFPSVFILYGLAIADILRIVFLAGDMPLHSLFFGTITVVPLGIIFSLIQWQQSKDKADARAILKWMNLSIYIAVLLIMGTYFIPIVIFGTPYVNIAFGHAIVVIVFLGFAFAITRYRLFDIERWWIDIWLWFFAGILILATDFVLAYAIKMNHGVALAVALIIVGWLYFPLRQAIWKKLLKRQNDRLEDYLPKIVTAIARADDNIEQLWQILLRDIFNPLTLERSELSTGAPSITDEGLTLLVPGNEDTDGYKLRYADKGRRLFLEGDMRLTESLFNLVFDKQRSFASYMRGVHEERKRIVRDLHDDVAGRLLAIKLNNHNDNSATPVNEALTALRSVIYSLNRPQEKTLGEASTRWRTDLHNLTSHGKTILTWDVDSDLDELALTPHQILNLERVIREAFTNAMRHSNPEKIVVRAYMDGSNLVLEVTNNGNNRNIDFQQGNGLLNIKQRMQEMGGSMTYVNNKKHGSFNLFCSMPMEQK